MNWHLVIPTVVALAIGLGVLGYAAIEGRDRGGGMHVSVDWHGNVIERF